MTYDEKKSLYESIMKDVARIVKKRLNEQNSSSPVWNANLCYDTLAHLMFGVSIEEVELSEYKDIQYQMRRIIDDVSSDMGKFKAMNVSVNIKKRIGEIEFRNINETNLLDFTDFLITVLNNIGEAYISDFEACIDYNDIVDTLENSNPNLYSQFIQMTEDGLFN